MGRLKKKRGEGGNLEKLTLFNSSNKGREISTFFLGISFMATVEFCGESYYVLCIMWNVNYFSLIIRSASEKD